MQVHIVNDATIRVPVSVVDSITFDGNNSSTIIIDNIEDGGVTVNGQVYLFDFDGSKYATKDELELKQNKLKAGNNITIAEDGTISVSSDVAATDDDARQGVDNLRNYKADCLDGSIDNLLLEPYDFSNRSAWNVGVGSVSSDKDKVIAHKTYKQIYIATDNTVISSTTSQYNYMFLLKFKGNFDITNSVSVELYNGDKRIAYKSTSISSIQTIGEWSQSIININGTKNATSYKITINLKSSEDIGEVTMPILCELTNENMADLESSGYYDTFKISDKVNRAKTADVALAVSDSLCNDIIDKAKEDVVKADTKSSYSDVRVCVLGDSYTNMGCDQYTPGFIHSALKELGINISLSSENNFGVGGCWLSRGGGRSDSMVERYTLIPDCDVLTIMGGMNDGKAPYSTWQEKIGTSESVSTDTYWGALKAIIEGWQTLHPNNNTTIILMTYPSHLNYPEKKLINQAIRDCAELYGLPLVDFERNCGFKGHLQSEQSRANLVSGKAFQTGYLSVNDGKTIVYSQSANKYCEDYIEINASIVKSLWANTNNVIYFYSLKDGVYTYLGYENYGGGKIPKEATHIRVGGTASATMDIRVMDGQYISDGVHPNVLGFAKMAPILASKLREICWWRFVDDHTRR